MLSQSPLSPDPELMCGRRQIRLMLDVIIADHESLRDPGQGQWSEFRPPRAYCGTRPGRRRRPPHSAVRNANGSIESPLVWEVRRPGLRDLTNSYSAARFGSETYGFIPGFGPTNAPSGCLLSPLSPPLGGRPKVHRATIGHHDLPTHSIPLGAAQGLWHSQTALTLPRRSPPASRPEHANPGIQCLGLSLRYRKASSGEPFLVQPAHVEHHLGTLR